MKPTFLIILWILFFTACASSRNSILRQKLEEQKNLVVFYWIEPELALNLPSEYQKIAEIFKKELSNDFPELEINLEHSGFYLIREGKDYRTGVETDPVNGEMKIVFAYQKFNPQGKSLLFNSGTYQIFYETASLPIKGGVVVLFLEPELEVLNETEYDVRKKSLVLTSHWISLSERQRIAKKEMARVLFYQKEFKKNFSGLVTGVLDSLFGPDEKEALLQPVYSEILKEQLIRAVGNL